MDRIILRKADSVQRRIKRIEQEKQYNLFEDVVHQDALLLNLQRACQSVIDIAAILVKEKQIGSPNGTYELFEILFEHEIIGAPLYESMRAMVGFRNILVHDYTELDLNIVLSIADHRLKDLNAFCGIAMNIL